jgi:hypothetical protein
MRIQVNDTVRLTMFRKESINAYARVVEVMANGSIVVSNLNTPFSGSLCSAVVHPGFYTKV